MCGGTVGRALKNVNEWHPLSDIVDAPVIDPYLQGDLTAKGDVRKGSYVDKKNENLGLTDVSQAATFFAQTIAAAFGMASLFGAGATTATGASAGEGAAATGATSSGTGTATSTVGGVTETPTLAGSGGVQPGDAGTAGAMDAGGAGTSDAGLSNPNAGPTQGPTTGPTLGGGEGGTTLGGALKLAAQTAPLVTAAASLLSANAANDQAQNAENAANNLAPSKPAAEPQAAVDPDLTLIRKRNALLFGLDSPSATDLTMGKADMGNLGRVTLLGGSSNRLGA